MSKVKKGVYDFFLEEVSLQMNQLSKTGEL